MRLGQKEDGTRRDKGVRGRPFPTPLGNPRATGPAPPAAPAGEGRPGAGGSRSSRSDSSRQGSGLKAQALPLSDLHLPGPGAEAVPGLCRRTLNILILEAADVQPCMILNFQIRVQTHFRFSPANGVSFPILLLLVLLFPQHSHGPQRTHGTHPHGTHAHRTHAHRSPPRDTPPRDTRTQDTRTQVTPTGHTHTGHTPTQVLFSTFCRGRQLGSLAVHLPRRGHGFSPSAVPASRITLSPPLPSARRPAACLLSRRHIILGLGLICSHRIIWSLPTTTEKACGSRCCHNKTPKSTNTPKSHHEAGRYAARHQGGSACLGSAGLAAVSGCRPLSVHLGRLPRTAVSPTRRVAWLGNDRNKSESRDRDQGRGESSPAAEGGPCKVPLQERGHREG